VSGLLTVEAFCACGDTMRVDTNVEGMEFFLGVWHQLHTGEGHVPADRAQATKARARRARREARNRSRA
jgi:hypothetical protein